MKNKETPYEKNSYSIKCGLINKAISSQEWRTELDGLWKFFNEHNSRLVSPYDDEEFVVKIFVLDGLEIPMISKREALVVIDFSGTGKKCQTVDDWLDRGFVLPIGWTISYKSQDMPIHWSWFCVMKEEDVLAERMKRVKYAGFNLYGDVVEEYSLLSDDLASRLVIDDSAREDKGVK